MSEKTLHFYEMYDFDKIWLEYEVHFDFTKRIKYKFKNGDFLYMCLEVEWYSYKRKFFTFWKITETKNTAWIHSDNFEYRIPNTKNYHSIIVECEQ